MPLLRDLYNGETRYGFVKHRNRWFALSGVLIAISLISIIVRGFNLGVDFKGGNSLQFVTGHASVSQVQSAANSSGITIESVQKAGSGGSATFVVKTRVLKDQQVTTLKNTLVKRLSGDITVPAGNGAAAHALRATDISQNQISASWGKDVSRKAIIALIVFLIVVSVFISVFFEWRLAVGALIGLFNDVLLTAGVYSIVGFEVTPSTVVGLLTILGYSLYDNIVVYDKVRENTAGVLTSNNETYAEAANRAINQTLARSINTTLISLLPVAGLLFVGAGLLGVGDLKDLALVLFIGLASGAYSSLFLATPIAATLKERQPEFVELAARVAKRRAAGKAAAGDGTPPGTSAPRRPSLTKSRRTSSVAVLDDVEATESQESEAAPQRDGGEEPTYLDESTPVDPGTIRSVPPRPGARPDGRRPTRKPRSRPQPRRSR